MRPVRDRGFLSAPISDSVPCCPCVGPALSIQISEEIDIFLHNHSTKFSLSFDFWYILEVSLLSLLFDCNLHTSLISPTLSLVEHRNQISYQKHWVLLDMKLVWHPLLHFMLMLTYLQLLQEAAIKKDFRNNLNSDLPARESESSNQKAWNLDF